MTLEEKLAYVNRIYGLACAKGLCKTRSDFARLLDINRTSLSNAMSTRPEYLTDRMVGKVKAFATANGLEGDMPEDVDRGTTVSIIPVEAMAGTLVEFFQTVNEYDCEKMISPIKGADYAIKIYGDSMSPEFPSGSLCLIKRVDEKQFIAWNEVYVLDTDNGAVIKKIRKTEKENVVECVSINPNYQPFTIDTTYIHGWYRVLMVMSVK